MSDPSDFVKVGQIAPSFSACDQTGETLTLESLLAAGRWLVLYFYPRDNTPGCTTEAQEFSALTGRFTELGAGVVGVSPDSPKVHARFREKHQLAVKLLSDPDKAICQAYGVWQLKKFMGRESMGVVRSTVLIAADGKIARAWFGVRAKGHAEAVLQALAELQTES